MSSLTESIFLHADSRFIASLYLRYLEDAHSVDPAWQAVFQSLGDAAHDLLRDQKGPSWAVPLPPETPLERDVGSTSSKKSAETSAQKSAPTKSATSSTQQSSAQPTVNPNDSATARRMDALVNAYRAHGHTAAQLDPLKLQVRAPHKELFLSVAELSSQERVIAALANGSSQPMTLSEAQGHLQKIYCGTAGFEVMHVSDPDARAWLLHAIESRAALTAEDRRMILESLTKAEAFERFLQVKFPTAKRFGLEGGESLLPLLECAINDAAAQAIPNVVIGMAHRGRLNVLTHILGKPYAAILNDFIHGIAEPQDLDVALDVKYHAGRSHDRDGLHLTLLPNPSHLEMVNPVVLGKVRAQQARLHSRSASMGILIHGDAAFAGQGIVMESLMLSGLAGYTTGGTFHVVINNQVGFTTDPSFSRSSLYCTDIAKMIDAPVFHVNGDDPEAVIQATRMAGAYRQKFGKDVVLDLVCYRRHGHNEMDEPAFTQPSMYHTIAQHPTTRQLYAQSLVSRGLMRAEDTDAVLASVNAQLNDAFKQAGAAATPLNPDWLQGRWQGIDQTAFSALPDTGVDPLVLQSLGRALCQVPEGFNLNPKIQRLLEQRLAMLDGQEGLDWGMGEALAFATLLHEGTPLRLAGQDSGRGTFSHRHAVWTDQITQSRHIPLQNLGGEQAACTIIDSPLSELAALGFELGYAMDAPNALVMWEGQFGDFVNGAQVMIDQFLAAMETKWLRACGLTLLLPHGFEGQGPEHSSARLERFLQLCAENNMRVVNCTTPSNQFHVLRRQVHGAARKPLIAMTPKSLLRHKLARSPLSDFILGTSFNPVIADAFTAKQAKDIKRVIFCSGKVYYDLADARHASATAKSIALIRLEQLYPFPEVQVRAAIEALPRKADIVWCQEEPQNMGAWMYVRDSLSACLETLAWETLRIRYIGRRAAASPAVGSDKRHAREQATLIEEAITLV